MDATFESLSWQDEPHSASCSTNDKVIKFSFLAKLLRDSNPKSSPEHLALRPVRFSRTSDRSEEEASAKDILKRTIIKGSANRFGDRARENFLMKGKMLSASKKPLENQMHSFLLCLNQRINREAERDKNPELPALANRQEIDTNDTSNNTTNSSNNKVNYQDVFKNLREMRLKKPSQSEAASPPKPSETRQRSRVQRKEQSQTISYQEQNRQPAQITNLLKLPLPLVKHCKEVSFKKGYLPYDDATRSFLAKNFDNLAKPYDSQPLRDITAKAYLIINRETLTPVAGKNIDSEMEIASLSKIMTCYLALLVCKKYGVDVFGYSVRVGERAAEMPGTTAELQSGDVLTIYELLLGMMLPSGNDASVAVAQAMGKIIQRHKKKESRRPYYDTFIAHMNFFSRELRLAQTWNNSSGLSFNPNFSTPQAIALLACLAVRQPLFHRIVNTRSHELEIRNQRFGLSRKVIWRNTNRLLESGWDGVKTGTTENAGHCLVGLKEQAVVCVLDCESNGRRFSECVRLFDKFGSSCAT